MKPKKATSTTKRKPVNPRLPSPYGRMTAAELDREVARYDREVPADEIKPLTPAMKAAHAKARRRGRPVRGKGAVQISLTVEGGLLDRVDAYARAAGLTRAQLAAKGFELAMAE